MGPQAALLFCGTRLHLSHGPIDLIIGADGERQKAFEAARTRFETVLSELVSELPQLRSAHSAQPREDIARQMWDAVLPCRPFGFVTPMAAVAGAVADTVLAAMVNAASLGRAYVNNGGDIALHLDRGETHSTEMAGLDGAALGRLKLRSADTVRGIATSGRHGRSLSLGIADSVTVLAKSAAQADVAATLIANAVDLPGHEAISRQPATSLDPDSDLGERRVVTDCRALSPSDCARALATGLRRAEIMQKQGLIHGAALFLQGQTCTTQTPQLALTARTLEYA